jgi:hypothetical protein
MGRTTSSSAAMMATAPSGSEQVRLMERAGLDRPVVAGVIEVHISVDRGSGQHHDDQRDPEHQPCTDLRG